MKNYFSCFFVFVLMISCGKKEDKKESLELEKTTIENSIKQTIEPEVKAPEVMFTVQIAALENKNNNYEDIEYIKTYIENNLIKYRLGEFITYKEARETKSTLLVKYPDAFIQALKNGAPIHIKEALQN